MRKLIISERETDTHLFFLRGVFSNFQLCEELEVRGIPFMTTEHAFMWLKAKHFKDERSATKILTAINPSDAKLIGRGVLYLTTNKSGATGFINDGQDELLFTERNTDDWLRQANISEVDSWQLPSKGRILLFPHQVCHTVFPLLEDEKRIIIRFDLFFRAMR